MGGKVILKNNLVIFWRYGRISWETEGFNENLKC